MNKQQFKPAFTLAEALITLTILGVVATIAIPSMSNNYKKQKIESYVKKFYIEANDAIKLSEAKNKKRTTWDFSQDVENEKETNKNVLFYKKYFIDYLPARKLDSTDSNNALVVFSNGSGVNISEDGHRWLFCMESKNLEKDEELTLGSKCFLFGFYPNAEKSEEYGEFAAKNYRNRGIEPYVAGEKINLPNGKEDFISETSLYEIEPKKHATKIIQLNGWKVPKNYPVR